MFYGFVYGHVVEVAILVMVLVVYLGRYMVCFVKTRNYFPLYVFLRACVYASNMVGLSLALLGLHVMVHLPRLSSMCAPFGEFWSLYLGCRFLVSSLNRARLSTYDVELHVLCVEMVTWGVHFLAILVVVQERL